MERVTKIFSRNFGRSVWQCSGKGERLGYERSGFDLEVRYSLFLIATLSITSQCQCLKNGSDRFRRGNLRRRHMISNDIVKAKKQLCKISHVKLSILERELQNKQQQKNVSCAAKQQQLQHQIVSGTLIYVNCQSSAFCDNAYFNLCVLFIFRTYQYGVAF